jgi:Flp pilus assembly protein TadG
MLKLKGFARDRNGAAAVEFALTIPVMILLYYGMVEATQALLVNRRASYIATAVGDLVTQSAQVRESDVVDIFKVSAAVMKPFPTTSLGIRITSVQFDNSGVASIVWTRTNGGSIPAMDLSTIDPKLKVPNTAIMRAETRYTYSTPFQKMMPGVFTFKHKMDLRPRSGVAIPIIS